MGMLKFPIHYHAYALPAYHPNILRALLSVYKIEKTIDAIGEHQLLVKVDAAACNPSDIAFMQGGYAVKKPLPAIPGFEASGRVLAVGDKISDKSLIGKRVSCFTQSDTAGTWSEYLLLDTHEILLHDQSLSLHQSSGFFVNPFTAYALFELALERQSKAIVVNAAGSVVGSWLLAFAKQFSIAAIAIVRKGSMLKQLTDQGWDMVLNSTAIDFEEQLYKAVHELKADIAFDAVGGDMSGILVNSMPKRSGIVVYGGLSGKTIGNMDPLSVIFNEIHIRGFNLNSWMNSASTEKKELASSVITEMLLNGQIESKVQAEVKADKLVQGVKQYLGNMSEGKVIIRF